MEDIPGPTDFPQDSDAPGLRHLDSSFSCTICGETFNAPMVLPCGHSFCSLCIRQFLRENALCPQCRVPAEEGKLVKSLQLEEMCDVWRTARSTVLELLERTRRLEEERQREVERPRKRRRMDSSGPSMSANGSASSVPPSSSMHEVVEVEDDSEPESIRINTKHSTSLRQEKAEENVDCPICNKKIWVKNADAHIVSGCKKFLVSQASNSKTAWSNVLGGGGSNSSRLKSGGRSKGKEKEVHCDVDKIFKPSYGVLKDKHIRELLAKYDLPTTGTREQMVARHTQFVTLYNANMDRKEANRRSLLALRKDLADWEQGQTVKKAALPKAQDYLKAHKADFKRHVEKARQSAKRVASASIKPVPEEKTQVVPQ